MPHNDMIVKQVKDKLKVLGEVCDSGYLLAMHIRYTRPTLMFTTYPQLWLEHYGENGMMMVDPVVRWAMAESTDASMMKWEDLSADDPANVIAGSAAHGLHNGVSFAVGPIASRTIGSVTSSSPFSQAQLAQAKVLITDIHALTDAIETMDQPTIDALRAIG